MAQTKEIFALEYKFGGNVEFLTKIENLLNRMEKSFTATEQKAEKAGDGMKDAFEKADSSAKKLEQDTGKLKSGFDRLSGAVKGFVAAYAGISGISKAVGFGMGSMALADIQNRSSRQLQLVMKNMGSSSAFKDILSEASAIQGRTIYGDEAMIAGAGELATYVKDPQQLKRMMNLLTDYAAGMTGGGEVGSQQMVQLATGLGMAFDGNYRALRMKGFDTSELESLGDNATESQKIDALARSLESWNGLAAEMNKDPSAAAIRLKNKLGDLREELGMKLYPVYNKMVESLDKNLPNIQKMMDSVGTISSRLFDAVSNNSESIMKFGTHLGEIVEKVGKLVEIGAPLLGKLMEIPGLFEAIVASMAIDKLSTFTGGIFNLSGAFGHMEKSLRRANRELLTMGKNGKVAAAGVAAAMAGATAGFMGGATSAGGVVAGGLTAGATTLAATGNPMLALLATGGSFAGSLGNALYQTGKYYLGGEADADAATSAASTKRNELTLKLNKAYNAYQKNASAKNRAAWAEAEKAYIGEYGTAAYMERMNVLRGGGAAESAEAKSSVTNNYNTTNNSVTQNNSISAEFSELGNLLRKNLVEVLERDIRFDSSMAMEVAAT